MTWVLLLCAGWCSVGHCLYNSYCEQSGLINCGEKRENELLAVHTKVSTVEQLLPDKYDQGQLIFSFYLKTLEIL